MKKLISYIFPIYNEEDNIPKLYEVMNQTVAGIADKYELEFIFVEDGSKDTSLEILLQLHHQDERVKVIHFSRNFGHQNAVTAGIDYAQGDAVVIMDADMQDPPAVSLELIKKWEEGYEVVYAQRRTRKDTVFKKFTAHAFYRILDALADIRIPKDTGDFRLIDAKVAEVMRDLSEHNRFLRGLVSYVGFKQTAVLFDREERFAGETKYPLQKMLKLAFDGITSFSTVPLQLITNVGFVISGLSFLGILYALAMRLFFPQFTVSGWTMLIISILFIGGVQIVMLGVLGTYIGRIYTEVQGRPLYIVSAIYDRGEDQAAGAS